MLGRIKKGYSSWVSHLNKKSFEKSVSEILRNHFSFSGFDDKSKINAVSFSGKKYLLDQIYSILSFYQNVCVPGSWTIFSDGTYDNDDISLLESIPRVKVQCVSSTTSNFNLPVNQIPTLKKLFLFKEVEINQTTIFADSDILFYPQFKKHLKIFREKNWFLVDEGPCFFDPDFLEEFPFEMYPCNIGLLIINEKPYWDEAVNYIENKFQEGKLAYWTDQTAIHILTKKSEIFCPLNPTIYIVSGSDSFKWGLDYDFKNIAVRHFVGPVRHKMWQENWQNVLGLKV